jgi:hypothetical protein
MNVFIAPAEVFEEVKRSKPHPANWLVPWLLGAVVGVLAVWIMFSQESILRSVREAQEAQMQKLVDAGKMTQAQADQALQAMEKFTGPTMLRIFGSFGAIIGSAAWLFGGTLVLWLIGTKALRGSFSYSQGLEATGLASMINVVGGIVNTLLIVIMGNMMVTAGPSLLISTFDPTNKVHLALSALNVFTLWFLAVLSVGLAKLSNVTFTKAALWLYGVWALIRFGLIAAGMGVPG